MTPVMFRKWRCRWSNPARNRGCELQEMQARTGVQMPSTQCLVCAYDGNDIRLQLCTLIAAAVSPNSNPAFDAVPPATRRQSNCEIRGRSMIWSSSRPHFPSNPPIQAAKFWNLLTKRCQSPPVASRSGSVRVLRSSAPERLKRKGKGDKITYRAHSAAFETEQHQRSSHQVPQLHRMKLLKCLKHLIIISFMFEHLNKCQQSLGISSAFSASAATMQRKAGCTSHWRLSAPTAKRHKVRPSARV